MNSGNKNFSFIKHFLKTFFLLIALHSLFLCLGLFLTFLWLNSSIPSIQQLNTHVRTPSVTIQAADGTVIATYGDLYEEFINAQDLPPHVVNAFLAVEDKRFYLHQGFDFIGLCRAFIVNIRAKKVVQGGSTLTQQLAKNMLIAHGIFKFNDRSIKRKMQELLLALKLESYFSKDQILTLYLNRVYFGAGTFGIDAASRRYFQKSAKKLTLFEAAVLAGLLRAPSRYSPSAHPEQAISRARIVLQAMESAAFLDAYWKDAVIPLEKDFLNNNKSLENGSKYFADWVFESIPSIIGPIKEDIVVVTTLRPAMQKIAENVSQDFHEKFYGEYKYNQTALIAMTADGAVLSMVGGLNYGKSQFNRATAALRQPGSAFKAFVYLAALEAGFDKETMIDDSAYEQGNWKPGNYKWRERGEISVFEAFVYSVNSVCIRLAKMIGIDDVIRVARRLGISSPLNYDLSLALGAAEVSLLELTQAYAAFANYGYATIPYGIFEIRDKTGGIVYQHSDNDNIKVIEDDALDTMKKMLRAVISRGTGRAANVDARICGKTGSNSNRDAWVIVECEPCVEAESTERDEYSPRDIIDKNGIVLGVWIGNDSAEDKMAPHSTGGRIPARIAGAIMKQFFQAEKVEKMAEKGEGEVEAEGIDGKDDEQSPLSESMDAFLSPG
ncbi:MAG: PBP1A family penicillin-binding protein [Holosporales bacterium]|jgi:penicillin-binding protein 1A|nr:PBP1A family penicillin-binding protein [Holosporales bacterium]